jgi:hypothetical protein
VIIGLVVLVGAVLALLAAVISASQRRRLEKLRKAAAEYERVGQYEDACYHYAMAAGGRVRHPLADEVRRLWHDHGPLSFEARGHAMALEYCEHDKSCGEGYHQIVLQDVRKIIKVSRGERASDGAAENR